jgi:hypothetical protein
MIRPVFALAFLLFLIPTYAGAQSLGNAGTIQGTVTDPSGAAIPGAEGSVTVP